MTEEHRNYLRTAVQVLIKDPREANQYFKEIMEKKINKNSPIAEKCLQALIEEIYLRLKNISIPVIEIAKNILKDENVQKDFVSRHTCKKLMADHTRYLYEVIYH